MHAAARVLHIAAGTLGIVLGFVALYAAKGAWLHRMSGRGFVYAMVTMGLVGSAMAAVWGRQPASNIPMGFLVGYFTLTGLTAVRPPERGAAGIDRGLFAVALGVGLGMWVAGFVAAASPGGKLAGIPTPPFFVFGSCALLAATGDVRMMRAGGSAALRGAPRIARHLWRMCLALLIAAFSFFIGQAQVFPRPIRIYPLLAVPPLLVLVVLAYWLWRVRIRRSLRGLRAINEGAATASGAAPPS